MCTRLRLSRPAKGARISVYAQGGDYHDTVKKALKALARWLVEQAPGTELKVFVDTAPVMEKPLGEAAGIGWQGKHTNLVSREHGSWLFLGAIYTTVPFPPDAPHEDLCGSCRACHDACPAAAAPQLPCRSTVSGRRSRRFRHEDSENGIVRTFPTSCKINHPDKIKQTSHQEFRQLVRSVPLLPYGPKHQYRRTSTRTVPSAIGPKGRALNDRQGSRGRGAVGGCRAR